MLVLVAWMVGRILTDRYGWSQWLWWIPTPAVLLSLLIGALFAFRGSSVPGRRRRRVMLWWAVLILTAVYFSTVEHRLWRGTPPVVASGVLQVTHWNVGPATWHDMEPSINALLAVQSEITLLTDHGGILGDERLKPLTRDGIVPTIGRFGIVTRLPILTTRILIATNNRWVALVQVDAGASLGRPISILLVDLPSSLVLARIDLAHEVRNLLNAQKNVPAVDLVVGDFNITRGSASLRTLFPGYRNAYDEAGHGFGATFHREFPLYHLDQMLLGDGLKALRYDLLDTGIGRHRAQRAWVASIDPTR